MKFYIKQEMYVNKEFKTFFFIVEKSKSKHKKLKEYANNKDYWFTQLVGQNWFSGGFYPDGFINPSPILEHNPHGVVLNNNVLLLREIRTEKPKKIKGLNIW